MCILIVFKRLFSIVSLYILNCENNNMLRGLLHDLKIS